MKWKIQILATVCLLSINMAFSQCSWKIDLNNEIDKSETFTRFISENDNRILAYKLLYLEEKALATNLDELTLVSNNLDEIKRAGGYKKWKLANSTSINSLDKLIEKLPDPNVVSAFKKDWGNAAFRNFFENAMDAEIEGLIDTWKKLDDLGADAILKRDPDVLKYVQNGRINKINIEVEELLGGHSKARHGSHLSMGEMEQRVLGTHSSMPQSRSALKFDSDAIHEDAVSKAFQQHKSTIDNHFSTSDDYLELDFDYGSKVGEGYTNTGTRRDPVASEVESSKVRIALKNDPTNPDGYILDSAYPLYE